MMKKIIFGGLAALLVLVGAVLWWLSGNLDALIKSSIVKYGSEMTEAKVSVGSVELKVKDGQAVIRNLHLGNPAGFKTPYALEVGEIDLVIDMASLTQDVLVIRKILIKSPDVIYEKGEAMTNFDALQKNIAAHLAAADSGQKAKTKSGDQSGKKLIIEELSLLNVKAEASAPILQGKTLSVDLPDITMRNLGKNKGGLLPGELGQEIVQALKSKLSHAISFDNLTQSVGGAMEKAGEKIKGLFSR